MRFVEIGRRITRGVVALGGLHGGHGLRQFKCCGVVIDSRGGAGHRQRRNEK